MKSRFLVALIAIVSGIIFGPSVRAALITNNWNTSSGKWELGSNWSAGTPSPANVLDSITIGFPVGSRLITADATTVASNIINGCLTISNMTVGGTSMSPNTVLLSNGTGLPLALTIENSLTLTSHGIISITNASLHAGGTGIFPNTSGIFDDGVIVVSNNGQLITPNNINAPLIVGWNGDGQMMVQSGGYVQSYWLEVGYGGGSQGTLTIEGGTVATGGNGLDIGLGGAGAVWLTGGQLNGGAGIFNGQMTISNGLWQAPGFSVGFGQGTLTIAGGTINLSGGGNYTFAVAGSPSTIWMTGGTLVSPGEISIGVEATGNMTVSNGTWLGDFAIVGDDETEDSQPGTGTVTVAGGTINFSTLHMGIVSNCLGSIYLTGGLLTVTGKTYLGEVSNGHLTVSNGTFLADEIDVGASLGSLGVLTSAGGQVIITNGTGRIAVGVAGSDAALFPPPAGSGGGRMFVALNGFVLTGELDIGSDESPQGELSISDNGSVTVQSRMTVGDCDSNGFGIVVMTGGKLYVTNATHDATLEVRNGFFLLEGGTLVVDKLVITNVCSGTFDHAGGTLTAGAIVLDPNGDADGDGLPNWWEQEHGLDPLSSVGDNGPDGDPDGDGYNNVQEYEAGSDPQNPLSTPLQIVAPPFQITSIVQSGNNIVLTWNTAGGLTNQMQVASGGGGAYSTNSFTNLGAQMLIGGSGILTTNFTDVGAATNRPSLFYRVRLVP